MFVLNLPGHDNKRIRVTCENTGDRVLAQHIMLTYRDNPDLFNSDYTASCVAS